MTISTETFLFMPIGYGAVPWDSATATANQPLLLGAASDLLSPRHDRGAYFYFGAHPIDGQDETDYDNPEYGDPTPNGDFDGGGSYSVADVITLSDGSTVTVDSVAAGVVDQFTVSSDTSTGALDGATLTQASVTPAGGTGFTLTLDENNVTTERTFDFDLGATPPLINFVGILGAVFKGTGIGSEDVSITWISDTVSNFATPTAWGGELPYVKRGTAGPTPRLDLTQPDQGLADAELPAVMNQGRMHSYVKSASFPTGVQERYHRLTISHSATPAADQRCYVPIIQGGWGWQADASWAPGGLSRRVIRRPGGDALRGWNFQAQVVKEDVFHLKLMEWFVATGKNNRALFWQDPDLDERFIQNFAMVQMLDFTGAQAAGIFNQETSEVYSLGFNLAERFNDEAES